MTSSFRRSLVRFVAWPRVGNMDAVKDPDGSGMLVNELLCWYVNMIHVMPETTMSKLCIDKFDEKEIQCARDILFSLLIKDTDKPEFQKRASKKPSDSNSSKFAHEIYQLLQEYKSSDLPKFVALDLSKLPILAFESSDVSTLLLSMNTFQAKLTLLTELNKSYEANFKNLADNQTIVLNRLKELESEKNVEETPLPAWPTCDYSGTSADQSLNPNDNAESSKFKCEVCNLSVCDKSVHTKHLQQHHNGHTPENLSFMPLSDAVKKHPSKHSGAQPRDSDDSADFTTLTCQYCAFELIGVESEIEVKFLKHVASHLSDKPLSCKKCNFRTDKQSIMAIHILATHDSCLTESSTPQSRDCTTVCTTCGYKAASNADLKQHMTRHKALESHGIDNPNGQPTDNTRPVFANSLVEYHSHDEAIQTNEKILACPSCNFKCSSYHNMKYHMATHKATEVYICDEAGDCSFECDNMESLQIHKKTHTKKPTYANMAQNETQSQESWIGPFKNGRPLKGPGQAVPTSVYPQKNNNNNELFTNNPNGNSFNKPTNYTNRGTNASSSLSVGQHPHWAKVFATRYRRGIDPATIKKDLEYHLQKATGKQYTLQVEEVETRFNTYSSFKISCFCVNSMVFMDSQIWPENILFKWWKERRNQRNDYNVGQNAGPHA